MDSLKNHFTDKNEALTLELNLLMNLTRRDFLKTSYRTGMAVIAIRYLSSGSVHASSLPGKRHYSARVWRVNNFMRDGSRQLVARFMPLIFVRKIFLVGQQLRDVVLFSERHVSTFYIKALILSRCISIMPISSW